MCSQAQEGGGGCGGDCIAWAVARAAATALETKQQPFKESEPCCVGISAVPSLLGIRFGRQHFPFISQGGQVKGRVSKKWRGEEWSGEGRVGRGPLWSVHKSTNPSPQPCCLCWRVLMVQQLNKKKKNTSSCHQWHLHYLVGHTATTTMAIRSSTITTSIPAGRDRERLERVIPGMGAFS